MSEKTTFILLADVWPATERYKDHLLGRVIRHPTKPFKAFVPDPSNPEEILPELSVFLKEGVEHNDLSRVFAVAANTAVVGDLTNLLHAHAAKSTSKDATIEAGTVIKYQMINNEKKFSCLMTSPEYKKQVMGMVKKLQTKKANAAMVTGFLTCKDMIVSTGGSKKVDFGAKGRIPASSAAGGPPALDPKLSAQHDNTKSTKQAATVAAEVIFAVCYDEVVIENYNRRHWGFLKRFKKKKPDEAEPPLVLGDEVKGRGIEMFGEAEDDTAKKQDGDSPLFVINIAVDDSSSEDEGKDEDESDVGRTGAGRA